MKYSLRFVAILFVILGAILALSRVFWTGLHRTEVGHDIRHVLQKVYYAENRYCLEVVAQYDYLTNGLVVTEDMRHDVKNVQIYCVRYSSDRTIASDGVFEQQFPESYSSGMTTGGLPIWGRTEWVGGFVLPSARCHIAADGIPLLVVFDGKRCALHRLDASSGTFETVPDASQYRAELIKLYESSFAPEDVYWSYALLRCSDFFCGSLLPTAEYELKRMRVSEMHEAWRANCKRASGSSQGT